MLNTNKINKISNLYSRTNYYKNIFNIKNKERIISFGKEGNKDSDYKKLTLIPDYLDNSVDFSNKIFNINHESKGSYATVLLGYFDKKNGLKKKTNIVFKKINDLYNGNEYKALIFNYLLYFYYEINDPDKLKYLCKILEIGKIKKTNKIYAIMENCGENLYNAIEEIITYSGYDYSQGINFIFFIFKECLSSLKLIHDRNYLHLDIKPENYLINVVNNEINIKIIDYGFVKKRNTAVFGYFGTGPYIPNDWIYNYENSKNTTLDFHHDFFSLGCMFVEILFDYFYKININKNKLGMSCPLTYGNSFNVIERRKNYNNSSYNADLNTIKRMLEKLEIENEKKEIIFTIISKMINPNPSERVNDINILLDLIQKF